MCTVTYLPLENNSFILTSSRDEKVTRPTSMPPASEKIGKEQVIFPKDKFSGGTWIASSESGKVVCLLNGAFLKHVPQPPYKKSRGLLALDAFIFSSAKDFASKYDFKNIEPFTMVHFFDCLTEIRWDGKEISLKELDKTLPHIWSSVTLYSEKVIQKREGWFSNWLSQIKKIEVSTIRHFHKTAGEGDIENDILMNRNGQLFTVSITSIVKDASGIKMIYEDMMTKELYKQSFLVHSH